VKNFLKKDGGNNKNKEKLEQIKRNVKERKAKKQ